MHNLSQTIFSKIISFGASGIVAVGLAFVPSSGQATEQLIEADGQTVAVQESVQGRLLTLAETSTSQPKNDGAKQSKTSSSGFRLGSSGGLSLIVLVALWFMLPRQSKPYGNKSKPGGKHPPHKKPSPKKDHKY